MSARIVVLADVGQEVYHAGDEAMGHAAADELLRRGRQVLLLSRNPEQTRCLFGTDAAPTLAFPWPPAEREARLQRIHDHCSGAAQLPAGDPALQLIAELEKCDGVVIAGGGNLNSRFGWLLYERAAVVAIARFLGKPVVVSGQTLGPQLTAADAGTLAAMLGAAALSSVREQSSGELARRLGIHTVSGLDDASFLAAASPAAPAVPPGARLENQPDSKPEDNLANLSGGPGLGIPESGYIAVTVAPDAGALADFYALLGAELDTLHVQTGLPVVFLPHLGIGSEDGWDTHAHARIAAAMSSPSHELPVLPARKVAALTAGASLVVTSRYHPAVFALSHAVPVAAVAVDSYSGVRLAGVMANWGLEDYVLPLPALQAGLLAPVLAETWQRKSEISAHLATLLPSRKAWAAQWWDGVAAVFSQRPQQGTAVEDLPPAPRFRAAGPWLAAAGEAAPEFYARSAMAGQSEVEEDRLRSYTGPLERELKELAGEHQRLLNSRTIKTALSLHRKYAKLLRH